MPSPTESLQSIRQFNEQRHCGALSVRRGPEAIEARIAAILKQRDRPCLPTETIEKLDSTLALLQEKLANKDGQRCLLEKGKRTSHLGFGRCFRHCECKGDFTYHNRTGGAYRSVVGSNIAGMLDTMDAANRDLMDLRPELELLRAVLMDWTASVQRKPEERRMPADIAVVTATVSAIGKTVEQIHNLKMKTAVTFEQVQLIMEKVGALLEMHLMAWDGKRFHAEKCLQEVKEAWTQIDIPITARRLN